MFERLLVANRGEIAVRVLQACAEMGITGVAVHGPEDAGALHVRRAPLSLPISSYLDVEAVVDAARRARADALHPGYGFLSENPDLAAACAGAGIVFVGPPPEAMRLLGDKRRARALARSLEVPVLAGYEGPDAEDEPHPRRRGGDRVPPPGEGRRRRRGAGNPARGAGRRPPASPPQRPARGPVRLRRPHHLPRTGSAPGRAT